MNLVSCTRPQLQKLFRGYYAKYLSKHSDECHYIITYNENNTFTNKTFVNNKEIGVSNGIYFYINSPTKHCLLNIQYQNIFTSSNVNSCFHEENIFYPKLRNYTIGPFYTIFPKEEFMWLPIIYNHSAQDNVFHVLNFYKNEKL